MTTIATDGKTIAADSRVTGTFIGRHDKLFEINGSVFGVSGNVTRVMRVVDWLAAGCPDNSRPEVDDDFAILQLHPEGVLFWDSALRPVAYGIPHAAIGTGGEFAMGAMMAGKSPEKAVEIACGLDECSGPPIVSMRLPRKRGSRNG
jgi:hypothetical protein